MYNLKGSEVSRANFAFCSDCVDKFEDLLSDKVIMIDAPLIHF